MKKLKIAIITYDWPPRNSVSVHRPFSWARYWSENGHEITVLTSKKKSFDSPLDLDLEELNGVKVIEVPYKINGGLLLKIPLIEKLGKWLRRKFINYLGPNSDPRNYWLYAASPIFSKLARESDIVVSTYGPEVAHIIGSRMKNLNPSIYWIADYRDLWSENPVFFKAPKRLKEKIQYYEKQIVGKYADLITGVSEDICNRLTKLHNKAAIKITNGYDVDDQTIKTIISKKYIN